jgi:hypothetical protein
MALFLVDVQWLSIGELQVCRKIVINHVKNFGNTCSHLEKKTDVTIMVSHNLIHNSHSGHNWSMLNWQSYDMIVSAAS